MTFTEQIHQQLNRIRESVGYTHDPVTQAWLGPRLHNIQDAARNAFVREQFACEVLNILDYHTEWNADTLQEIAHAATDFGLASADDAGQFSLIKEKT